MNPYVFAGLKGKKLPVQLFINKTSASEVVRVACDVFDIEHNSFVGKGRKREVCEARHIVSYILVKKLGMTLKKVGENYLGKRDHTTVINSLKKYNNLHQTDEEFRNKASLILDKVNV